MRQEYPELVRHYWRAEWLWSGFCFAGSVGGVPLSFVKQYIEQQNRPSWAKVTVQIRAHD
ncbi:transposase [Streptomyces griseochromogenes]|uniref:transposase n=1 Tax=Streptomyces griseochromogenes TaxID=68214 RepID=UPI00379ACF37